MMADSYVKKEDLRKRKREKKETKSYGNIKVAYSSRAREQLYMCDFNV